MFGQNNYFFDLLAEDLKKRSKESFYTIKTQIKDFDINDVLNKFKHVATRTATIDGIYTLQIEAPGFKKDEMDINLVEGVLTIKAKNANRTIDYKADIGEDKIEKVTLELGILELRIKEVAAKDKSTKINID